MVMRYAEVKGSELIKYPYLFSDLQADNPSTNYGDNYDVAYWFPMTTKAIENGYSLSEVDEPDQPSFDPATQNCALTTVPVLSNGKWTINWEVTEKTSEEKQQYIDAWRSQTSCTPFQGRMALSNGGYLAQAQALIDQADEKTKVAWEYALVWNRTSAMIESLAGALGLSDVQVDELFKEAQKITA